MTEPRSRLQPGAKQIRDLQRAVHLLTGALLLAYVYLPLSAGSPAETGIRWVALPLLALSGVVMWQWPKIRRFARQRGVRL